MSDLQTDGAVRPAFLAATGVAPLLVRRVHVDADARMLERHGAAPTTIARRLACLAGLYAYEEALRAAEVAALSRRRS